MRFKLGLIAILTGALIFSGCAASMHPGQTSITKPSRNEDNEAIWLNYYQDQFDAFNGNVIAPTADFPDAAKQGYQRAKLDWDAKVQTAAGKTFLAEMGIGFAASLALGVIVYTSMMSSAGY